MGGVEVVAMSASLHYTPVRELHNYRDQYAPSFKPYTSSATYPGAETNKYKPDPKVSRREDPHGSSEFAGRAGEHGGSFYNHRPNEVGWTSGPYSGHDARHSGFNPRLPPFQLRLPPEPRVERRVKATILRDDPKPHPKVLSTSGIHASHAHTAQEQPRIHP